MTPHEHKKLLPPSQALKPTTPEAVSPAPVLPLGYGYDEGSGMPGGGPNPTALWQSLRRRWRSGLALGLLAAAAAIAAIWFFLPPKYVAEARLQVAANRRMGMLTDQAFDSDYPIFHRTQANVIKSRGVLLQALKDPRVVELGTMGNFTAALSWLDKNLKVDYLLGPETLRVTLSGDNPEEVALVLNAIVEAYLKEAADRENGTQLARIKLLSDKYTEFQGELQRKRKTLQRMSEAMGAEDPKATEGKYQAALTKLNDIEKEQRRIRLDLQAKRTQLAFLDVQEKDNRAPAVSDFAVDEYLKGDPAFKAKADLLAKIDNDIAQFQAVAAPGGGERQTASLMQQRDALRKSIDGMRDEMRPAAAQHLRGKLETERHDNILTLRTSVELLKKQIESLDAEFNDMEAKTKRLAASIHSPDRPLSDLDNQRADVAKDEETMKKVGTMLDTLRIEPTPPPRVSLMDPAEPPQEKDFSKQLKLAGMVGFSMFSLALFGVSWWEYRARRIYAVDDVVQGIGMNLVGTLPALPLTARRLTANGTTPRDLYWQSVLSESVDSIRTLLLHAAQTEALRVVMVTSALGGEGKTSLASHLATSLARAWRKTLFIDGDLRNPAAHRQFEQPLEPGLSEVLRGEVEFDDVIRPTAVSRLWMIPAGHWDGHAIQALAQEGVRSLFERLKEQFDFIIIDSSPVLPVADSLLIAQNVDGVIFSILRDVSRTPTVQAAYQRLASLGVRMLGAVVIGADSDIDASSRSYPMQPA
jgi:succinoglycan biosynthesis transport protein ExoP